MKIALCSSYVPFINGGSRNIVDWLGHWLVEFGHEVEYIYLPHVDNAALLFKQMAAYRWIDLPKSVDKVICFRPPSHFIPHSDKVLWFSHHIRAFYDLWNSRYRAFPDDAKHQGIRDALHKADIKAFHESRNVFAISEVVTKRLKQYNNVESEVLYPPVLDPTIFFHRHHNDEILCISRFEQHKRQHLLINAMQHTKTPIKLRMIGLGSINYIQELQAAIVKYGLQNRIILENRWITEKEKVELLADCLAVANVPLKEDFCYVPLEAMYASKPVITTSDSGGILEFITHDVNGLIAIPEPEALAEAMDRIFLEEEKVSLMSKNAGEVAKSLNINWSYTIKRLLS